MRYLILLKIVTIDVVTFEGTRSHLFVFELLNTGTIPSLNNFFYNFILNEYHLVRLSPSKMKTNLKVEIHYGKSKR